MVRGGSLEDSKVPVFFPPFLVFFFLGDDDAVFQKLIFRRGPTDTMLPAPLLLQISCTEFTSRGVVLHFMTGLNWPS